MKKKAQVEALPSEKAIYGPEPGYYVNVLELIGGRNPTWHYRRLMDGVQAVKPHYIYFTTDEEIKEGDWMLNLIGNPKNVRGWELLQAKYRYAGKDNPWQRRIVAATNPDLWSSWNKPTGITSVLAVYKDGIAKIPTDFIEAYAREQGNIKEVMLEWEPIEHLTTCGTSYRGCDPNCNYQKYVGKGSVLKLRSNGTVIIHPIQEKKYTREEVRTILNNFWTSYTTQTPLSWFDQNYPQ